MSTIKNNDPYFISSDEEAALELKSQIDEVAWPIDDEGYLDALDAEAEAQP